MRLPDRLLWTTCIVCAVLLTRPTSAWPSAQPETHRIAVVIGNNIGAENQQPLRYAEAEAREMLGVLHTLGGFEPGWTYLLTGAKSQAVQRVFQEVNSRIADIGPQGKVLLFLYYSGHADGKSLQLGSTELAIKDLRSFILKSGAAVSVAIVDACHSGTLARVKGVRREPGYSISTLLPKRQSDVRGHVIITSSGPEELSQETNAVHGSYFSHYIMSGMRGAADTTQDGEVTLSELYHFAYSRTLARTSETLAGPQHATREIDLSGTGELVLTTPRKSNAAIRFPGGLTGTYFVIHKHSRALAAEVELTGDPARVALPADTYLVRTRSQRQIHVSQVNLNWGGEHHFDRDSMASYPVVETQGRGLPDPSPHRLTLGVGVRNGTVKGLTLMPTTSFRYRYTWDMLAAGIRIGYSSLGFEAVDTSVWNHEFDTRGYIGVRLLKGVVDVSTGVDLGVRFIHQRVEQAPDHGSIGGLLEANGTLEWLVLDPLVLWVDAGVSATLLPMYQAGLELRPELRVDAGLGIWL